MTREEIDDLQALLAAGVHPCPVLIASGIIGPPEGTSWASVLAPSQGRFRRVRQTCPPCLDHHRPAGADRS